MDNKQIALSDVERYKELFEYEMTEVILQLRGEFAKVSGKDLNLEHAQFSAPDIDLGVGIPSVELEPIALKTQEITGIVCESTMIPSAAIDKTNVSCPTVPVVNIKSLEDVQIDKSQLSCPAVNVHISADLKKISVEKIILSSVNTDITVPQVCEDSKVAIRNIALAEIDGASPGVSVNIPNVDVSVEPIDVPDTDIKINSNIALKSKNVEVDIPVIHTIPVYEQANVSVDNFTAMDLHSIPKAIQCDSMKVDTAMPIIDVVDTDILIKAQTDSIELEKIKIDIPAIGQLTISKANNPELSALKVEVPKVSALSFTASDDLILDKIHLNGIDEIPILNANLAASSEISVRMPSINIEYPTASTIVIPDVIMKKSNNVEVPELQDFSREIREIIDTACLII